jgi:desulfoferrodoxin FeS4 iron-binding domain/desulfoferrodoxin ferrous iron-binding domain
MKTLSSFFKCEVCGNIAVLIKSGGGQLSCCGKPMTELIANATEASTEKHIPVVTRQDGKIIIQVGSVLHPMTPGHFIEWIAVVSDNGIERITLTPNDEPKAVFCDRENAEVYAYCNLHGLWKAEIK